MTGVPAKSSLPLARQVANLVRTSIQTGQFRPGARVPSTRALSAELGVSRNTVLEAYAQLLSEGYFESRTGSGTFVTRTLRKVPSSALTPPDRPRDQVLSHTGFRLVSAYASSFDVELKPFTPGIPSLEPQLFDAWATIAARQRRALNPILLNYGDPLGFRPLREAIAAYIGPTRGITCTPDQVIVTSSAQHGLALSTRLLLDPGDEVLLEDPGYSGARAAFLAAGARIAPMSVSAHGWNIEDAIRRCPLARVVYVSPSHQYPLGVTMELSVRAQLLEWAERTNAWILEDDYDAEFRHSGRSLPSLQGLDRSRRVIYVGTFSKVLFPALRIGYLVVPTDLIGHFSHANAVCGHVSPTIDQAILAEFISHGHFARHLRRLRRRYQHARALLEKEAERLREWLTLSGAPIGMHVVGYLAAGLNDRDVSHRAAPAGLCVPPLAAFYGRDPVLSGVVLGFGHLTDEQIRDGMKRLIRVFREINRRKRPYVDAGSGSS
jgi:GntR family transcriptional regulator/MocR family aminotransferase